MIMIPAFDNTVDKSFIFVGLSTIVSISYFQETNRSIASKKISHLVTVVGMLSCWWWWWMEFRDLHEVVWSRNWSLIMPYTSIRSVERCLITYPLAMPNSCQAIRQILYNLSNNLARSSIFLVWNGQCPKYPKYK